MFELKKKFKICAAHRLNNPEMGKEINKKWFGRCNEVHGHNYSIILTLRTTAEVLGPDGMMINFNNLKDIFNKYIDDVYDHTVLNDSPLFKNKVVTAEYMAKVFYEILKPQVKDLYAVEIEETEGASAKYFKSDCGCK